MRVNFFDLSFSCCSKCSNPLLIFQIPQKAGLYIQIELLIMSSKIDKHDQGLESLPENEEKEHY